MPKASKHSYLDWDDESPMSVPAWPTGNIFVDWMTGCGGLPMGRVVECFGPESSGKSTLGMQCAANVWHTFGIPSTLYDFEDVFDARYAKALGLTKEGLNLEQPNTLEEFFAAMDEDLSKSPPGQPVIALAIIDSVASARTADDVKNAAIDNRTAGMNRARLWTQWLGANVHRLNQAGITLHLVNQLRDYIDTDTSFKPPGVAALQPKNRTPGGRGIKFYASLRLAFEQSSEIRIDMVNPITRETEKTAIGKNVWLKVVKNKVAPPPWRKMRLQIRDGIGFDLAQNLLDFAQVHDIVNRKAGVWTIPAGLVGPEDLTVAAQDGVGGDARMLQFTRTSGTFQPQLMHAVSQKLGEIEEQLSISLAEAALADASEFETTEEFERALADAPDVPALALPGAGGNASLST